MYENISTSEMGQYLPVPQETPFFHGTRAPEFEKLAPGTCLAKDIQLARSFALGGSYFAIGPRQGTSRVMTVHLDLPQGAPLIPMSPLASQLLSLSFQDACQGGVEADQYSCILDGRRIIRQAYHQDAIAAAQQMGLDAYYADLDQQNDRILVILNSGRATIVSQALENEPPPTGGPRRPKQLTAWSTPAVPASTTPSTAPKATQKIPA